MTAHEETTPRMFWAKTSYFFYYSALAALLPFLALYYERLGFSGAQIGILTGIPPLMTLVGAPLWGGLADLTQRHKTLLILSIISAILISLGLAQIRTYALFIPMVALFAFAGAPIIPLVDNTVIEMLGKGRANYGKQRLWGAVGYGLSAPLIGRLIETSDLTWAFWGYAGLLSIGLLAVIQLPISQKQIAASFRGELGKLLRNRRWMFFLGMAFAGGISMSSITSFLFLHMNRLGATEAVMGLAITAATLSELPVMNFGNRLMARWGSRGLLTMAMGLFGLRLLGYALTTNPTIVLLLQLLHGPTFAALLIAGVSYAAEISPEGMGATAQGMFSGTVFGLGSATGGFLSGTLYGIGGSAFMYQWLGIGVLLSLGIFTLAGLQYQHRKRTQEHDRTESIS